MLNVSQRLTVLLYLPSRVGGRERLKLFSTHRINIGNHTYSPPILTQFWLTDVKNIPYGKSGHSSPCRK